MVSSGTRCRAAEPGVCVRFNLVSQEKHPYSVCQSLACTLSTYLSLGLLLCLRQLTVFRALHLVKTFHLNQLRSWNLSSAKHSVNFTPLLVKRDRQTPSRPGRRSSRPSSRPHSSSRGGTTGSSRRGCRWLSAGSRWSTPSSVSSEDFGCGRGWDGGGGGRSG